MSIPTAADEVLAGPKWQALLNAIRELKFAEGDLFEGLADDDAEAVEQAIVGELASHGYLAQNRTKD